MNTATLTIDDFPSPNTPAIVDYLCEKGIRVIFFTVGTHLERHYDEAVSALRRGMIAGNHSYSHPHFSQISYEQGVEEIEKTERMLDKLYADAGVARIHRPFRFPYGDKGGKNRDAYQRYLRERGFSKVKDTQLPYPWWKAQGLDRDIDTLWTFDFAEYRIRPGTGFTKDDVFARMHDANPADGAALFGENQRHILLLHDHPETQALVPGYYRLFIEECLQNGLTFDEPEFL